MSTHGVNKIEAIEEVQQRIEQLLSKQTDWGHIEKTLIQNAIGNLSLLILLQHDLTTAGIKRLCDIAAKAHVWTEVEKAADYQEHHYEGKHDVGVAWTGDRLWVCLDGASLFRAKLMGGKLFTSFTPPEAP